MSYIDLLREEQVRYPAPLSLTRCLGGAGGQRGPDAEPRPGGGAGGRPRHEAGAGQEHEAHMNYILTFPLALFSSFLFVVKTNQDLVHAYSP